MNTKKIIILGSAGMAGHIVALYLEERGYDVYRTTSQTKTRGERIYYYDVMSDYKYIESIISFVKPDFIINCIGILNNIAEECPEKAILINSFLPHYINSLAQKYLFKFVHMSTDCVFSGEKGNYEEQSIPDAQSYYGKTKALGEIVKSSHSVTLRTSIVGPDIKENGIGLLQWFLKQESDIRGFSNVIWTGVTTLEFAKSVEKIFDMNISGLYHLVNNQVIDKHSLLCFFQKYSQKAIIIAKDDSVKNDKSLTNTRKDFDFSLPNYEKMIQEMFEWIQDHKDIYPHYYL